MIELYDLVGANDLRFSPFCSRTKAVLRYKNFPYTTETVRFTEKHKLTFSGQDRVPVIRHDDGAVVSDSWAIACDLEERQTEPRIFPRSGTQRSLPLF